MKTQGDHDIGMATGVVVRGAQREIDVYIYFRSRANVLDRRDGQHFIDTDVRG